MPVRPLALLRRRRARPRAASSRAQDIVLWVTSSGTPTPRPSSWRGWKTRPWIRRPVWDDVATFDGGSWRGAVDIVTAGYPCQPFSVAGKRRGAEDPRHLWPHVARIIGEVEPPFVFLENVAHHLRLGFPEVAAGLVGMGLSYDFPRLPCDKGAAARHPKYAGQRRGTDREWVGRCGPCGSVIAPVFSHDLNG